MSDNNIIQFRRPMPSDAAFAEYAKTCTEKKRVMMEAIKGYADECFTSSIAMAAMVLGSLIEGAPDMDKAIDEADWYLRSDFDMRLLRNASEWEVD
jgi:hypothetical protein